LLVFMFFSQVKHLGDNFSYIVADDYSREAAVIDSSYNANEIAEILKSKDFKLKYIINTHGHSDHTAGNTELRAEFGGRIVAHESSKTKPDVTVTDGEVIVVGAIRMKVIHTPGHAPDSVCLLVDGKLLLTGDVLFVGECGRTDLLGGDSKSMYDSLFNKLMKLKDDVKVYPGHDYGLKPYSTIGEERKSNYTLKPRDLGEFVSFMKTP
jgi:hydroxyacylglutathione hydrolase